MKRRRFLQITITGALAFSLSGIGWLVKARSRTHVLAFPEMLILLGSEKRIREIGAAYRNTFPGESTSDALSKALISDSGLSANISDSILRDHMDQQVRRDFEHGRIVRLNGWILSRTEARQSALYSILYS
jgi:hypothetical protein